VDSIIQSSDVSCCFDTTTAAAEAHLDLFGNVGLTACANLWQLQTHGQSQGSLYRNAEVGNSYERNERENVSSEVKQQELKLW